MDYLEAVNLVVGIVGGVLVVFGYFQWRKATEYRRRANWLRMEGENALKQIQSDDRLEVLAGLQKLAVLNDPKVRFRAIGPVQRIIKSSRGRIRVQAEITLRRILEGGESESVTLERGGSGEVRD